jgi:hypothetical protein
MYITCLSYNYSASVIYHDTYHESIIKRQKYNILYTTNVVKKKTSVRYGLKFIRGFRNTEGANLTNNHLSRHP